MRNHDYSAVEQPSGKQTHLAVIVAVINSSADSFRDNCSAIDKIQPVLAQIAVSLAFVPFKYRPGVHCSHTL